MKIEDLLKIIPEILQEERTGSTFRDYVNNLLNRFKQYVDDIGNEEFESYHCKKNEISKSIEGSVGVIIQALESYETARVKECIESITDYIQGNKDLLDYEISADSDWYRMRLQEKNNRAFLAHQMFHVPFSLRGKVSTQRFSLPGYPCLYISQSILAAWEEMHEPELSTFCVSRLKATQTIKVLDLRLPSVQCLDKYDMRKLLCTLPWIIACSMKVESPEDNFKPEYIIPQMVMLALVNNTERLGCAYTSTRRNNVFHWPDIGLLDNVALPVQHINERSELCSKLCGMFRISDSTNYDYELIKEPFQSSFVSYEEDILTLIINKSAGYKDSIFGQMQERLSQIAVKDIS